MANIYQTFIQSEATYQAWLAPVEGLADLWVYALENRFMGHGDAFWYITKNRASASSLIYFSDRGKADFSFFFVHDRGQAGWRNPIPQIVGKL